MTVSPLISVIIPVKSPEPYLTKLKSRIRYILQKISHEILIQQEPGLGYAVQCGIKRSKGDVIVVLDADGSHDPKEIIPMFDLLHLNNDIVIGSRYVTGGCNNDTFIRRCFSKIFNKIARVLLSFDLQDSMSGYVMFRKNITTDNNLSNSYKFLLPLYSTNKYKIVEHPIQFHQREKGKTKMSFREPLRILRLILTLFLRINNQVFLRIATLPILYLYSFVIGYLMLFVQHYISLLLFGSSPVYQVLLDHPFMILLFSILLASIVIYRSEVRELEKIHVKK